MLRKLKFIANYCFAVIVSTVVVAGIILGFDFASAIASFWTVWIYFSIIGIGQTIDFVKPELMHSETGCSKTFIHAVCWNGVAVSVFSFGVLYLEKRNDGVSLGTLFILGLVCSVIPLIGFIRLTTIRKKSDVRGGHNLSVDENGEPALQSRK